MFLRNHFNKDYYFGQVYDNYDTYQNWEKIAKKIINNYEFDSFLDIGCGLGNLVKEVKKQLEVKKEKNLRVFGVDISNFAVKKANVDFILRANCTHLPFKDGNFDLVYILTTFSYIKKEEDLARAVREVWRVAKKLIIFEDVYSWPSERSDDWDPYRVRVMNQREWEKYWKKTLGKNILLRSNQEEMIIYKKG
ncbi:class I SAM-dependent methyltransferase [Candidatus Bathyarchaeota archaeon]|nr:class I SAM-dependent methyltransferase [Candidatus Bathyarchaeota archaeon]